MVQAVEKTVDSGKAVEKTVGTSRAAWREVMREENIPTSQQPKSQSKNASGREYSYDVPKDGGGKQAKSVQQQTLDRSHKESSHWEAGKVKKDDWGNPRPTSYGRPKLDSDKSKVYYNSMETLEQKKRRLFGRKYLPEYLKELSRLLKREVKATELLSILKTDEFINSISHFKGQEPDYKETISFSDKTSLITILCNTIWDWEAPYMMYLSHSLDCGLMKISSLFCFNLNFGFNDEHGGIIIFTRADGKERIILDYNEEYSVQMLEIEIYKKKTSE